MSDMNKDALTELSSTLARLLAHTRIEVFPIGGAKEQAERQTLYMIGDTKVAVTCSPQGKRAIDRSLELSKHFIKLGFGIRVSMEKLIAKT